MSLPAFSQNFKSILISGALLTLMTAHPFSACADDSTKKSGEPGQSAEKKDGNTTRLANKKVTLQMDEASLLSAIRAVMKSVDADFTVDPALRDARVTVSLTNIRLGLALDLLMKVSTIPATYHVEDGVYQFELRKEEASPEPIAQEEPKQDVKNARFETIKLRYADAAYMAWLLGGQPFSVMGQNYGAFGGDFSGSKTFSNSGIGGFGAFGGSGTAILGNQGGTIRNFGADSRTNNPNLNFNNGLYNIFNNLLGGGGNRR